jgi:hypothetical protein
MSQLGYEELKMSAQVAGPTLSNSIAQTSIVHASSKHSIAPNNFYIGKAYKITATGQLSNIVTTPGTLQLQVKFGSTVVFDGGAMQLSTTAHTTLPFWCEIILVCRAIGTSANLIGQGRVTSQALSLTAVADSATTPATLLIPNTTPAVGSNFDSTTSQIVDLFGTFSIANAGNAITLQTFLVEEMN